MTDAKTEYLRIKHLILDYLETRDVGTDPGPAFEAFAAVEAAILDLCERARPARDPEQEADDLHDAQAALDWECEFCMGDTCPHTPERDPGKTRAEVLAELEAALTLAEQTPTTTGRTILVYELAIDLVEQMADAPARDPEPLMTDAALKMCRDNEALLATMLSPRPLAVGDRVMLKSGGPVMEVVGENGQGLSCRWPATSDTAFMGSTFRPDMLRRVEP